MLVNFLIFNLDSPLLGNRKLRQAISYALDRPELVRQLGPLQGKRTDQVVVPGIPGYRDWNLYPLKAPDLARARALAKGNLRGGKVVLYAEAAPGFDRSGVAGVVKYDLARIGLDVEVREFDIDTLFARTALRDEPWDIAETGWYADFADRTTT